MVDPYPKTPGLARSGLAAGAAALASNVLIAVVAFAGATDGWGPEAALWIGVVACLSSFAAIALGIAALRRLPHSSELGGGLAITGIVLGALTLVVAPAFIAVAQFLPVLTLNS